MFGVACRVSYPNEEESSRKTQDVLRVGPTDRQTPSKDLVPVRQVGGSREVLSDGCALAFSIIHVKIPTILCLDLKFGKWSSIRYSIFPYL